MFTDKERGGTVELYIDQPDKKEGTPASIARTISGDRYDGPRGADAYDLHDQGSPKNNGKYGFAIALRAPSLRHCHPYNVVHGHNRDY